KDVKVEVAYIGSFTDTAKAKEITLAQYSNGADVVFTAAGPASAGSVEAAKDAKKYVIGVDSDQALAYEGKEEQKYIISSALKNIDTSLVAAMDEYLNDSLEFNTHSVLGIKENAVGLAENDIYTSTVSEEIRNKVNEVSKELKEDKIKVNSAIGMEEKQLKEIIKNAK
ncbi:MAG: BMP family lipoprotein, partial [Peptostreptococcaceae bacterium]